MSSSAPDMEVEESSPVGGGDCSESPAHIMEPHVELNEVDALEPNVEINLMDHNVVEPHVELDEHGNEQNDGNVYTYDALAAYYDDSSSVNPGYADGDLSEDQKVSINGMSQASGEINPDVTDSSILNTSSDIGDITMSSTSEALDSSMLKDDEECPNYNEMQRTYLNDFFSSSESQSFSEEPTPSFERIPLSRFPTIVKVVERAEYETIQTLYQLLYQRSAWDTQEILSKRILEFSGFNFGKKSEEYYNRELLLQSLPNAMLVKIGAILCLDQVKNVLSNVGLGRHDLITAIMDFLALPRKKTRTRIITGEKSDVEPCGCRNNCLAKFTPAERELLKTFHRNIKGKRKQDVYFLNLIDVNKSVPRSSDSKKHRDFKYNYKIKIGKKEVHVCKGGFMLLHDVKMSVLNQLQAKSKKKVYSKPELATAVFPCLEGEAETESQPESQTQSQSQSETESRLEPQPQLESHTHNQSVSDSVQSTLITEKLESNEGSISVEDSSESFSSKTDVTADEEDSNKGKDDLKVATNKVPAVLVEKIDPNNISAEKAKEAAGKAKSTEGSERKKLKEFPLVVKSMADVSEELLIDLHFLLFLKSAESEKRKENILEFDGFKFGSDSEEYDERNEFLQRMSGKLITDVARSFSLGVMSKREETIDNILKFLMKPDESFLRVNPSVPVILSDVELDDIEGMSDSDESITCEVVEKKVECIDLLSSGDESDKERKSSAKSTKIEPPKTTTVTPQVCETSTSTSNTSSNEKSSGGVRHLRDFETIRKIVNTHPPEYLVDIYELLYLKKHEPATLRQEILDFTGFDFEKGTPEYVKRKQVLDRMLYNNVRRVYNTLIHNSTEVKVFSKPTMINEIFQFLFKLPDHDTSVRPLPPGAKTLMPKQTMNIQNKGKPNAAIANVLSSATILPSQTGKLSDLKRVFQRVACFPCEYLVDVHKLLFMTDCDPKVIRQNIFGFKGFSFSVDSPEFQQRKMYLEYLTFHSLRKISSVLTTRSVDLRNSTKHELASHLTDVLAEYCNTNVETDPPPIATAVATAQESTKPTATPEVSSSSGVENIVITPIVSENQTSKTSTTQTSTTSTSASVTSSGSTLGISIVETRSISSPAVSSSASPSTSTTPSKSGTTPSRSGRKRKNQTIRQLVPEKKQASVSKQVPPPSQPAEFADINLPEVEQYRKIYGPHLNVYPNVPTITGIASFGSPVPQTFPHLVPQMTFPLVSPYHQMSMQQSPQVLGLQSTALTIPTTNVTLVSKPAELIVPAEVDNVSDETHKSKTSDTSNSSSASPSQKKQDNSPNKDAEEEDGDKPLASLIGHPIDSVIEKHIRDIVENTDLQDITMNKVIQRIYDMYPKFDLSYRKDFIKSTLRTILYKLGDEKNKKLDKKEITRDSNSPDCSVTTTDNHDNSLPASPDANIIAS